MRIQSAGRGGHACGARGEHFGEHFGSATFCRRWVFISSACSSWIFKKKMKMVFLGDEPGSEQGRRLPRCLWGSGRKSAEKVIYSNIFHNRVLVITGIAAISRKKQVHKKRNRLYLILNIAWCLDKSVKFEISKINIAISALPVQHRCHRIILSRLSLKIRCAFPGNLMEQWTCEGSGYNFEFIFYI